MTIFDVNTKHNGIPCGKYFANSEYQTIANKDGKKIKLRANNKFDLRDSFGKTISVPFDDIFSNKKSESLVSRTLNGVKFYKILPHFVPMVICDPVWSKYYYDPSCKELYCANDQSIKFQNNVPLDVTKVNCNEGQFNICTNNGSRSQQNFKVHINFIERLIANAKESSSETGFGYYVKSHDEFGKVHIYVEPVFYKTPAALKFFHVPSYLNPKIAKFDFSVF